MKPDISSRSDIEKLMKAFYDKVKSDKRIGFFFSRVIPVDWESHMSRMVSFWENVLFYTGNYEGDPLITHQNISRKFETTPEHFERWLQLFCKTTDHLFKGSNAEKIKGHARSIAAVMQQRVKH